MKLQYTLRNKKITFIAIYDLLEVFFSSKRLFVLKRDRRRELCGFQTRFRPRVEIKAPFHRIFP